MEIIEGIYRMVQSEVGSPFWDLYIAKIVTHKDGTKELGWKIRKYSIPLLAGIKIMAEQQIKVMEEPDAIKQGYSDFREGVFDLVKRFSLTVPDYTSELIKKQKDYVSTGSKNSSD